MWCNKRHTTIPYVDDSRHFLLMFVSGCKSWACSCDPLRCEITCMHNDRAWSWCITPSQAWETCHGALHPLRQYIDPKFCCCWIDSTWDVDSLSGPNLVNLPGSMLLASLWTVRTLVCIVQVQIDVTHVLMPLSTARLWPSPWLPLPQSCCASCTNENLRQWLHSQGSITGNFPS